MAWEDCVVDVHSVKLSQYSLESIFSKCGAVKSVMHWKGQGEKQHVFMEYGSPGAADAARAIGLDRSDLQVIKLSNNEMLKKKFRELERPSGHPRSTGPYIERGAGSKTSFKDHCLPVKPTVNPACTGERDAGRGLGTMDSERSRPKNAQSLSASLSTSSFSSSRVAGRSSPCQINLSRSSSLDGHLAPPRSSSTFSKVQVNSDACGSCDARDPVSNHDCTSVKTPEVSSVSSKFSLSAPRKTSVDSRSRLNKLAFSPAIIEIPHAGEIIKFDLDKQLEPSPAGIIRILSTVKADQKLWMMTAAHYNSKRNLQAAKEVLEAAIDMAALAGTEMDTKPFWHLLSQINGDLKMTSSTSPEFLVSTTTSAFTSIGVNSNQDAGKPFLEAGQKRADVSSSITKDESSLPTVPQYSACAPHDFSGAPDICGPTITKTQPLPRQPEASARQHLWPIGPRTCDLHLDSPASLVLSSGPMGTPGQLHGLQIEIDVLRKKQNAVLEDLSFMRAAKRRAEEEVKEERSVRRKLEKHLKAAEDALTRSKRMEDAALDQVKREVEARRKAEDLLAAFKVEKDRAGGGSPFAHPSVNDAAMLLASIIRASSSDPANLWQLGLGAGVAPSSAGSQPET